MKLHILSDLHLGVAPMEPPRTDADVVILAGDIGRPEPALAWARAFDQPVLYVPGNHEFYGGSLDATVADLKRRCAGTAIRVLDNREAIIDGVRFLGTTLWSDLRLFGEGDKKARALREALILNRDFSRIRIRDGNPSLFSPAESERLFDRAARWLAGRLDQPFDGPTVVITHHAPSRKSIHPRFADSLLNACFVSDADHLLDGASVALWIHGHTHDSFDYDLNGTRVLCNPRGYAKDGVSENARFNPHLIAEVG
jgi:predicted phosphodiesterase